MKKCVFLRFLSFLMIFAVLSSVGGEVAFFALAYDEGASSVSESVREISVTMSHDELGTVVTEDPYMWKGRDDVRLSDETNIKKFTWVTGGHSIPRADLVAGQNTFSFDVKAPGGIYDVEITPVRVINGSSFNVLVDGILAGRVDTKDPDTRYRTDPSEKLNPVLVTPDEDGWVNIKIQNVSKSEELYDRYFYTMGFADISLTLLEENPGTLASTEIMLDEALLAGDEEEIPVVAEYSDGRKASAQALDNTFSADGDAVEVRGNRIVAKQEGNARITVVTKLKGTEQTATDTIDVSVIAEGIKKVTMSAGGSRYIRLTNKTMDTVPLYVTAETNLGDEVDIAAAGITYEALNPELAEISEEGIITPRAVGDAEFKVTLTLAGKTYTFSDTLKVIRGKNKSSLITKEMRANAAENIETYAWAKKSADSVIKSADMYAGKLDELYTLFTSEGLPRSLQIGYPGDPNGYTCQYCDTNLIEKYSTSAWISKPLEVRWKVRCPECWRLFPSNDFGSFYELGLNEYGEFDRMRALENHRKKFLSKIESLYPDVTEPGEDHSESWYRYYGYGIPGGHLTNDLHPEVGTSAAKAFKGRFTEGERSELWSVDDGLGYFPGRIWDEINQIEEHYSYIALYIHDGLYRASGKGDGTLQKAIDDLAQAYAYTGDKKYGIPAAILVDRLADLYPGFDFQQWGRGYDTSHGGTLQGKIVGCIWGNNAASYARAYDYVFDMYDEPEVVAYIREKSKTIKMRHAKETPSQIRTNVEDGIIREIFEALKTQKICGNFGYPQETCATIAAAMNSLPDTQEMVDFLFAPGFTRVGKVQPGLGVYDTILSLVDYDGLGDEASHYNYGWFTSLYSVQKTLEKCTIYDGADMFDFPRFKKMATSFFPLTMSGYTVNMGDSGQTVGNNLWMGASTALSLYRRLGDARFAQYAYMVNGNTAEGLHEDIYTKYPEIIADEIEFIIDEHGTFEAPSELLGGYGFATMKEGKASNATDNRRGLWMYWGNNVVHGHQDSLNIAIDAFGLDFTPDLGYPPTTAYTSDNRHWVRATLSHNTVQVGVDKQDYTYTRGKVYHYDASDEVKFIDVDAHDAYEETDIYRRSVVMVNVDEDNSYYVDFFRIKGGDSHEYSFHAQSDTIAETEGLDLTDMSEYGSYAGIWESEKTGQFTYVPFGPDPYTDITKGQRYPTRYPMSYTWLENVQRQSGKTGKFEVDFAITDFAKKLSDSSGLHLRATMLGIDDGVSSAVSIADGYPPQKAANKMIPKLKYLLVKREGKNLDSLFTTVFEPYRNERTLENIEEIQLQTKSGAPGALDVARAVKVTHSGGNRIDYVLYSTNNGITYSLSDNGVELDFRGAAGVYTLTKDGNGNFRNTYRYLNDGDILGENVSEVAVEGRIYDFTKEHTDENEIVILLSNPISDSEAEKLAGRYIFVDNDGKLNASYRIRSASAEGDRLKLDIGDSSLIRGLVDRLDLSAGYVYNVAEADLCRIPLSFEGEGSNAINRIPGDADGDGKVNSRDLIYIRRYIAGGYGVTIDESAADVDGNGDVNSRDIIYIRRWIAGGYDVELK